MSRAVVVTGDARYSLLGSTAAELAAGLRDLGHDVELAAFPDSSLVSPQAFEAGVAQVFGRVAALAESGDDFFILDMNCRLKYSGQDPARLKRFSYVTDAPWSQFEAIRTAPPSTVISYVDRSHTDFYRRFPIAQRSVFMPHGGPLPDAEWHEDRPIGVLFLGNLSLPCRMEHFEALTASLPEPVRRAARLAAALMLDERVEPLPALEAALASAGLSVETLGVKASLDLMRFVCRFAEAHNRVRLLSSLDTLPITVAGGIAPGTFAGKVPSNLTLMGIADEQAAMALMRRSRILLNSVTVFPDGSHERLWYGMACGAALCTEHSRFVEESFAFGPHLLSLDEAVDSRGESLRAALAAPGGVLPQARAARDIYAGGHTWRHRARIVHQAMAG